ncbi:MAG: ATP-binding protein, partial [Dehalococcoidales bacterium]|nr:ATP-binding protein [Dehalococcoidales bacterium]
IKNIDIVTGLLQRHFIKKDSPVLGHGAGLALDLENSLRRSSIETPRYEFKQGLLSLSSGREYSNEVVNKILETICGIANVGPEAGGYIFLGVADKKEDAEKIRNLDGVTPISVGQRYVVGIDREVSLLKISQAEYVEKILNAIRSSELTKTLKQQVLAKIDVPIYKGCSVIRLTVPPQTEMSFLGKKAFVRSGSSTVEVAGPDLVAINKLFMKK